MNLQTDPSASSSESPLEIKPRISQRAPTSCSFCYRRKIRCDRNFPCQNCLKRGAADSCVRETVVVRGELVTGAAATQRVPLTADELRTLSEAQLRTEVVSLRKKLSEQERTIASLKQTSNSARAMAHPVSSMLSPNTSSSPKAVLPNHGASGPPPVPSPATELLRGGIQKAVVGEPSGTTTPRTGEEEESDVFRPYLRELRLPIGPSTSPIPNKIARPSPSGINSFALKRPRVFPSPLSTTVAPVTPLLSLVPLNHSLYLVEATLRATDWIHGAVHVPTYIAEHRVWIEEVRRGGTVIRDEYLALYFAIIASGLYFLDSAVGGPMGLSPNDIATLPTIWFEACLEALNRSDFLSVPMLESLQTICILPMISHNFGATAYIDSLLHCGLRIAQSLNLHLLGPETEETSKKGLIGREIGRRIWMLLTIAESHTDESISYALFLPQAASVLPANVNDEDLREGYPLVPRPPSETTLTSHMCAIAARARIFRSFTGRFYAAQTLEEQYSVVIETDALLLNVLNEFPNLAPRADPYPTSIDFHAPFDYVPMSRFMWSITIPPTRIILYRSFLGRSYTDERFSDVRHICVEAAKQVLIERRRPMPSMFQKPWHISAYTVLAGVVLVTELVHGRCTPAVRAQLHADVQEIISLLPLGGTSNKVVLRGIELLTRVLEDAVAPEVPLASVESLWPPLDDWNWKAPIEPTTDIWANTLRLFDADDWVGEKWWIA